MATVQTTITFKSKKLRFNKAALESKCNDENLNVADLKKRKVRKSLKRSIPRDGGSNDGSDRCSSEECSPRKVSRAKPADKRKSSPCVSESEPPPALAGREDETRRLRDFLEARLRRGESGSLYVSGPPGTGKTATLSHLLRLPEFKEGFKQVYINCTMMKSAGSIYQRICTELKLQTSGTTEKACLAAIEKYLSSNHKMTLLVLDEIDQLDSKRQAVLYTIFEWAARPAARLALVGAANALDLTERALPRLRERGLRPDLLHFAPYTRDQIVAAFTRVLAADRDVSFSPHALQMLAAKIAAVSGDMRRALDIGKRVVELAKRRAAGGADPGGTDPVGAGASVELRQVLAVLDDVYGSSLAHDVDEAFPLQQKLLVCSLMLMLTRGKNKDITVGKLYDVYKRVASARNICAVDSGEFVGLCSLVEARGALRVWGAGREPRARRLALLWDQAEAEAALRDKTLLAAILNDVACLAR